MYIGQTSVSSSTRFSHHKRYLRTGSHFNRKLQTLYDKNKDFSLFELIVLEKVNINELCSKERYYIEKHNTFSEHEFSCNSTAGGLGNSVPMSKESIDKMRDTIKQGIESGRIKPTIGETNGMHILTEPEVIEVVDLLREGRLTHKEIGSIYNVSRSTIGHISQGKRWGHLKEVSNYVRDFPVKNSPRFTDFELTLVKYYAENTSISFREMSVILGRSSETLRKLKKRNKRYLDIKLSCDLVTKS